MTSDNRGEETRDEAARRAVSEMRERAAAMWGEERASTIAETLERTARAVQRLLELDFAPEEGPAFFFGEYSPSPLNAPDDPAWPEERGDG